MRIVFGISRFRRVVMLSSLALCFDHSGVLAQDELSTRIEHGTIARPLDRRPPRFPTKALEQGLQGWVLLSYVVATDGSVKDPSIENSSGVRDFEKAALRTVTKWKFEPAMWDGEPVEQCHTETIVSFAIEGQAMITTEGFVNRYNRISKKIEKGDLEGARKSLDSAMKKRRLTMYELARLWILDGNLAQILNDDAQQLASYQKAAISNGRWLEKDVYRSVLRAIVVNELKANNYASAIRDYEKLLRLGVDEQELDTLPQIFDSIYKTVASEIILATPALLHSGRQCDDCKADWQYQPLRHNFTIADVQGSLANLEIRCDWKHVVDEAREGIKWAIPASWGSCRIIIFGDDGTSFSILEEPDTA